MVGCEMSSFSDSPIPTLALKRAEVLPHPALPRDSIIILEFEYTDGDGDLGYVETDTLSGNDLLISFRFIKDNIAQPFIIPVANDTLNFNRRLPYLTPSGSDKSIKGTIKAQIPINPYPDFRPDSVFFNAVLFDRSFNQSNEVETPILVITH